MEQNIKIAKQLIKLAKELTASSKPELKYELVNIGKELDVWFQSYQNIESISSALLNLSNQKSELDDLQIKAMKFGLIKKKDMMFVENNKIELHFLFQKKSDDADEQGFFDYLESIGAQPVNIGTSNF